MKTALRTYHPVPSLQKTDGNAQDAPRIKNCLKAALLPAEQNAAPATPDEVLQKRVSTPFSSERPSHVSQKLGQRPPTSVVNLVFVLANHAAVMHVLFPSSSCPNETRSHLPASTLTASSTFSTSSFPTRAWHLRTERLPSSGICITTSKTTSAPTPLMMHSLPKIAARRLKCAS